MRGLILLLGALTVTAAEIEVLPDGPHREVEAIQAGLERDWQGTAVTLPEGRHTLADLVALIAATGLDLHLDGACATEAIDHPGFAGSAWEALLEICAWYEVRILPGADQIGEQWWARGEDARSIPWQSGGVVLAPLSQALPPPAAACGPLLVEARRVVLRRGDDDTASLDLSLRLRAEPRRGLATIGDARVLWTSTTIDGAGHEAVSFQDADRLGDLRFERVVGDLPLVELHGEVRLQMQEPFAVTANLKPGDTAVVPLGSGTARIQLLDRDQAKAAGKRAACVVLTYPAQQLNGPFAITVADGDETIASQGSSSRHDFDADSEQVQYLAGLGADTHRISIRGLRRLGTVVRPVALSIDTGILATAPRHGEAQVAAAPVDLPDGPVALGQALQALRASGNEVLVDLGVDTTREAALPGGRQDFWEAVLAVATAFDLDILPPLSDAGEGAQGQGPRSGPPGTRSQSTAHILGGPVRLGRGGGGAIERLRACGPLLVECAAVERLESLSLDGASRSLVCRARLRVEPRLATKTITDAVVWWSGTAGRTDAPFTVTAGPPDERGLLSVTLTGLPAHAGPMDLDGLVAWRIQEPVSVSADLTLGQQASLVLGEMPVSAELGSIRDGTSTGLILRYVRDGNDRIEPQLIGPDGKTLSSRGRSSRGNQRSFEDQWNYPGLEAGAVYRLTLGTVVTRGEPTLPLRLRIEAANRLPDGDGGEHPPAE